MIFIFDLDSTLLNTNKFFKSFAPVFGLSVKEFIQSKDSYFKNKKDKYSLLEHIKYLRHNGIIVLDRKTITLKIQGQMEKIDNYLFRDAEPLLKLVYKNEYELILVTYGNKEWQQAKVDNLSITKYFSRIIVTDQDKRKELGFLKNSNNDKIYIINDKASETLALKEFFGERAKVFLIKSHRSQDVKHNLRVYNLNEVRKEIQNEFTKTKN